MTAHRMNWDATAFVVFNLDRQRCALYIPGKQYPEFVQIKRGLELLIHERKMIGFGQRGVDGWSEFAHIEVWRHPEEGMRPTKKEISRSMLRLERSLRILFDVRFWKEQD